MKMATRTTQRRVWHIAALLGLLVLILAGCKAPGLTPVSSPASSATTEPLNTIGGNTFLTPRQLREAYGVESLYEQGFTGKGQTVVVIDSFGSPTLQQDMDLFDRQYGLPDIKLQILSPLGTKPFDQNNNDMVGWAYETSEDVQIIHAIAPDAGIVVMTSPVAETEGVIGLPEFLQLEQYAVNNHLGTIVSQSWGVSEVTLTDSQGQAEIARWNTFFQQATTQQGITFFSGSGDSGATDYQDLNATELSPTATTSFPADSPWVTSVGGTTLIPQQNGASFTETAWPDSGGGFSRFYAEPSYQQALPQAVQRQLDGRRGVPDVSSSADVNIGPGVYVFGQLVVGNGTSAGSPLWSGLTAIASQMAGHPLGYISPALYQLASSGHTTDFRDITTGDNSVNHGGVNVQGYPAVLGWDPVTGLGSPNAEKLLPDLIAATKN
ncbi:MAG TPA: S53 family peptidase [Ktedonobacterales bacterium]|jgi:subtilase family serine protease|nr:S53 family peptidase [Ktedonobacterales bacterium]